MSHITQRLVHCSPSCHDCHQLDQHANYGCSLLLALEAWNNMRSNRTSQLRLGLMCLSELGSPAMRCSDNRTIGQSDNQTIKRWSICVHHHPWSHSVVLCKLRTRMVNLIAETLGINDYNPLPATLNTYVDDMLDRLRSHVEGRLVWIRQYSAITAEAESEPIPNMCHNARLNHADYSYQELNSWKATFEDAFKATKLVSWLKLKDLESSAKSMVQNTKMWGPNLPLLRSMTIVELRFKKWKKFTVKCQSLEQFMYLTRLGYKLLVTHLP